MGIPNYDAEGRQLAQRDVCSWFLRTIPTKLGCALTSLCMVATTWLTSVRMAMASSAMVCHFSFFSHPFWYLSYPNFIINHMTLWVAMLVSHLWSTSWVMFPVHLQNFCSGQGCQNWCRRETVGHCCSQGYSCLLDSCQQIFHAVSELRLEPPGTDMDKLVLESLFEVCWGMLYIPDLLLDLWRCLVLAHFLLSYKV